MSGSSSREQHWEGVYSTKAPAEVSWHEDQPAVSLRLIEGLVSSKEAAIIDVGGGASTLAGALLARGHSDLTVLDVSAAALAAAAARLDNPDRITWLHEDLLTWQPGRRYDVWHDRAVFHFLTNPDDRGRYLHTLAAALNVGGVVILGTFANDGPESCSGLPVGRYNPEDLAGVLGDSFTVITSLRQDHVTPWGAIQPFTWITARHSTG